MSIEGSNGYDIREKCTLFVMIEPLYSCLFCCQNPDGEPAFALVDYFRGAPFLSMDTPSYVKQPLYTLRTHETVLFF